MKDNHLTHFFLGIITSMILGCFLYNALFFKQIRDLIIDKVKKDTVLVVDKVVNIPVQCTVYEPDTLQCDNSPMVTASGNKITRNSYYSWCAVSRDLMYNYLNFGDTIVAESGGITQKFVVMDNMNSRWNKMVDILVPIGDAKRVQKKENILNRFLNTPVKIIKIIRK